VSENLLLRGERAARRIAANIAKLLEFAAGVTLIS